jgi:hypothetical protein
MDSDTLTFAEASAKAGVTESIFITRQLTTVAAISQAMRSQFESEKKHIDEEFAAGLELHSRYGDDQSSQDDGDLGVQVHVATNVTVEHNHNVYERESYRKPRVQWDHPSWGRS